MGLDSGQTFGAQPRLGRDVRSAGGRSRPVRSGRASYPSCILCTLLSPGLRPQCYRMESKVSTDSRSADRKQKRDKIWRSKLILKSKERKEKLRQTCAVLKKELEDKKDELTQTRCH